jgi:uncharacterized membrane protein
VEATDPTPETPDAAEGVIGDATVAAATPSADHVPHRRRWSSRHLTFLGLVFGVLSFGWALTPSLLPRPWLFEGVIAGLGAALGYGLGVLLSWVLRRSGVPEPSEAFKRWAWRVLTVIGPIWVVIQLLLGTGWQNEVRTLVGEPDEGLATSVQVIVVAVPVAVVSVLVGRGFRKANGWIGRQLDRVLPRVVSAVLAVGIIAAIVWAVVTGLLFNGFVAVMNNIYASTNASTRDGITPPVAAERSGSATSLAAWSTLGMEGRNFTSRGPTPQQLQAFSGKPAKQSIRVYVGLDTAPTAHDRAALAEKELERTGAYGRKILVVAGTTGTGWLEPQTVDTIEYEWNGDSAIVGIQYSFLPSWISTLVDVDRAREAGKELFDAVYAHWSTLPAASRPQLMAYGLSLGSFSSQSAFSGAADVTSRTQGAVWVGSPNFTQPWGSVAAGRADGSPQWKPVYDDGIHIRYAGVPTDLAQPAGAWDQPRVAYVQHANDPVVWWSPALLAQQPDWLREPPGPGRTPTMRWYPVLTFLQVTVDQFVGVDVPQGQGHNYGTLMPSVWAQTSQPPGWTDADTTRLEAIVDAMPLE